MGSGKEAAALAHLTQTLAFQGPAWPVPQPHPQSPGLPRTPSVGRQAGLLYTGGGSRGACCRPNASLESRETSSQKKGQPARGSPRLPSLALERPEHGRVGRLLQQSAEPSSRPAHACQHPLTISLRGRLPTLAGTRAQEGTRSGLQAWGPRYCSRRRAALCQPLLPCFRSDPDGTQLRGALTWAQVPKSSSIEARSQQVPCGPRRVKSYSQTQVAEAQTKESLKLEILTPDVPHNLLLRSRQPS